MKLAVGGKGGAGKTTIAGTLARVFAERGHRVVAIDDDSNPNLALTVGVDRNAAATLEWSPARSRAHGSVGSRRGRTGS
jgi:CO dehydrogenase maturation factor